MLFDNIFFYLNSSAAIIASNFSDFNFAKSHNEEQQNSLSSSLYACKDVYCKSKAKHIIFDEYEVCPFGLQCFHFCNSDNKEWSSAKLFK